MLVVIGAGAGASAGTRSRILGGLPSRAKSGSGGKVGIRVGVGVEAELVEDVGVGI